MHSFKRYLTLFRQALKLLVPLKLLKFSDKFVGPVLRVLDSRASLFSLLKHGPSVCPLSTSEFQQGLFTTIDQYVNISQSHVCSRDPSVHVCDCFLPCFMESQPSCLCSVFNIIFPGAFMQIFKLFLQAAPSSP